ncbi:FAD dependent oxidoreductase [Mucor mucedo]|uniref:FAD dependent oxidoreductase n=1 Tax=Mucor mucedo TaxID=29922 RepID=UPI00222086FF|nr:FAD dependent oxidoreductase [Mucor mucedo]KAI7896951.1 FAD dependent oxidoreductase [Mucor mucedo]
MNSTYQAPTPGSKIIIVGGGCFGLSTALALSSANKNYRITVYDRESIPVRDAASNDISKVVRMDYGSSKLNMQLAIDSIDIWNQWNQESSIPVYHNTGMLIFSGGATLCENEQQSLFHIRNAGHGDWIEELNGDQIQKRYPYLENAVRSGLSSGYYNKVGGWCNSAEAIKLVYQKCKNNGVQFILGKESGHFESLLCKERSVIGIKTKDGVSHQADRVIMATGSWTPSVIDMKKQVIATGQVVIHFRPSEKIKAFLKDMPVWFGDFSRSGFYGFPINKDGIMKVAKHSTGYLNPRKGDRVSVPRTQSTHEGDTIPVRAVQDFREYLKVFLPVTEELDITYARVCWYADSIDGEFIIAPHPDYDNLVVATGDSGHAMKFLPMIGTRIAQVVENIDNEYTRAWAWRTVEPRAGFYDRPLLVDENQTVRMVTPSELRSSKL